MSKRKEAEENMRSYWIYVIYPAECWLVSPMGTLRSIEWEGPIEQLEAQLERRRGQVVRAVVRVSEDGNVPSCPLLDTISHVEYQGFDQKLAIDLPGEILRLPRLKHLSAYRLRVRRIPRAILDTSITSLLVNTIEPPWFLVESPIEVDGMAECQLEPFRHLRQLLLLGLGEETPTPWSSFLKLHRLHDPRLFLFVAEFLK